jgi:two-component system, OmpR family, sensor histidine kinase ChvG
MKLNGAIRGPRLGTKLALLGFALLIIPGFSYRQLVQMEQLLIQIQSQALLLNARNISTLFNGRDDLFEDLPVTLEQFDPLFAHPLQNPVRLDGFADDWEDDLEDEYITFQSGRVDDGNYALLLGERDGQLYGHLKIRDDTLIFRDPEYLRLDNSDHVRILFISQDGSEGRISLIPVQNEEMTGFAMDSDWRFAETGSADNRIQGRIVSGDGELQVEFRFPIELLGSRRFFGVNWVDVDDPVGREVAGITQGLPTAGKQGFNLVVLQTPEVRNIVEGLGYSGARILVVDTDRRVRAEIGAVQSEDPVVEDDTWISFGAAFAAIRPWIHTAVMGESYADATFSKSEEEVATQAISASLEGNPLSLRGRVRDQQEIILAAYPIISSEQTIGTVVVEQNIDDILSFQQTALEEIILVSIVSLMLVLSALLAFAGRLAWRIRNLRREASAAIDSYGRLKKDELNSEMNAGDEIGDLARSVSNMLSRLQRHNTFLESMPRTLRHEINNPLNTMSTSLQNLAEEYPDVENSKYLESAKRGVNRIGSIVQNLADAANLEDALEAEELEPIDLNQLLQNYVANCNHVHAGAVFVYRGPAHAAKVLVSDFRIEQLLDKIVDNAVDFHRPDSSIRVQLDCFGDQAQLTIANRGPVLPSEVENSGFDSMVSHRAQRNRLHFGLGLYVVRVIAEHHGGFVRAINLADGSGVAVLVQLPLAEPIAANAILANDPVVRNVAAA